MQQFNERIWLQLKALAADYAASDKPLPDKPECERQTERILRQELGSERVSAQGFAFYSMELCAMIESIRKARGGVEVIRGDTGQSRLGATK